MIRKPRMSTFTTLACALGGLIPAQAGPFEDMLEAILRRRTAPQLEMAVRLAKEDPRYVHLVGHNLGEAEHQSTVLLELPAPPPQELPSTWHNSHHLQATLPGEAKEGMRVAVQLPATESRASQLSHWESLPARVIGNPLELIEGPAGEQLERHEAFDTKAAREGLGALRITFEVTQGHRNAMVAQAFGLTTAQVAERLRNLEAQAETKAAPSTASR